MTLMPPWKTSRTICRGRKCDEPNFGHTYSSLVWPRQPPTEQGSIASPWEVGIKISTGKLVLGEAVDAFFDEQIRLLSLRPLPISLVHIARVATLPFHRRDPFDRMLVAQSLTENMAIVSADAILDTYGVTRLW